MHPSRKIAGPVASLLLALIFGLPLAAVNAADLFLYSRVEANTPLPVTLRLPELGRYSDTLEGGATFETLRTVHPRGSRLSTAEARVVAVLESQRRPPRPATLVGLGLATLLVLFLFSRFTAAQSAAAGTLRAQWVLLGLLTLFGVAAKTFLLLTPWSAMWIPIALCVIPAAHQLGMRTAATTAIASAVLVSLHSRIDLALLLVLIGQGLGGAAGAKSKRTLSNLWAGLGAAAGGGTACVAAMLLLHQSLPGDRGVLIASLASGPAGALLAPLLTPLLGRALGFISRARLMQLADLDNPLLKQLAQKAPGTWAHSMAMANMAEMAANAIGANGLLVRVGAYYHDLGKALQPHYFIENQEGQNPHDALDPDVSADAIFAHVVEGTKLARKHKLHPSVEEFIWTHHGDSLLEYFWHKNEEKGNAKQLTEEDFRYPGRRPTTKETAILALCDSAEAASRTLEGSSMDEIRALVARIVMGKLRQGALDDSGLTLMDLQRVMDSLADTLKSARHGRIRYPWQDDPTPAPASAAAAAPGGAAQRPAATPATPAADKPELPPQSGGDPAWARAAQPRARVHTKPMGTPTPDDPEQQ